jgi:dTDP-4-dehydrorhamnose reductase
MLLSSDKPLRLMILGVNGQVGWQLHDQALKLGILGSHLLEIIPIARQGTAITLDLTDTVAIKALLQTYKPNIVINAAAYTAVDRAESEPELAHQINTIVPEILAQGLADLGGLLVHYSTDYVFDGTQSYLYSETDLPNPINIYGQSKLQGEQAIQNNIENYLILRTSWVYDIRGRNFLLTMLRLAHEKDQVRVVNDQMGSPTSARLIAQTTYQLLTQYLDADQSQRCPGLYHLTTQELTSWYGFAQAIFTHLATGSPQPLAQLIPIPTADYPALAQRPTFSGLNCQKLMRTLGISLPHWNDELWHIWQSFQS